MNDFPLNAFLASLAADGFILSVRDYNRLVLTFQTGGDWTILRLKNVLVALLAKNEDQQRIIQQRFDKFFKQEKDSEKQTPGFDIQRVLKDLKSFEPKPCPVSDQSESVYVPEDVQTFPSDKPEKSRVKFAWWIIAGITLVIIAFIGIRMIPEEVTPPEKIEGPVVELSHSVLDFRDQLVRSAIQKEIILTNVGAAPLKIENIILKEQSPDIFQVSPFDFPITVPINEEFVIPVSFVPKTAKIFIAELEITHNAENNSDNVALKGTGMEKAAPSVRKRLYRDVPYVKDIKYDKLERPTIWMKYAGISVVILFITLIYAIYLRRLKKGPQDNVPDWDRNAPMYFNPGSIGGKPLPRLDEAFLSDLADSMGYFKGKQAGKVLNVPASIKATVRQGGIPACDFFRRSQIRTLLILEDANAEALEWNTVSRELAMGMIRYGVPVIYGQFRGSPEKFRTKHGSVYDLDDLEDQRNGILMLIFTDGKVFHGHKNAFALEAIARWPMTAWMELREQKFWDETTALPIKKKIPLYPATRDGVFQAIRRFMTEQGAKEKITDNLIQDTSLPDLADTRLDAWLEHVLGEAILWAQDCSMIQPVSLGLADGLRVKFHPNLPMEQIECLYALPNTALVNSGLHFSDEILKELRKGFLNRRTEGEQRDVVQFILDQVEQAKPNVSNDSLAYLSWEAVKERVRLELGEDDDLKRFGELVQTPLGGAIGDSLDNYGFSDQPDKIPLRKKPGSKKALQRLARVMSIKEFVSWKQRVSLGVLILSFFIVFGWMVKCLLTPIPNLEIAGLEKTPAQLEIRENDTWKVEKKLGEVGEISKNPLLENRKYRIILYGNGYRSIENLELSKDQKVKLFLAKHDVERKCIEEYSDISLTVECCPEVLLVEGNEPLIIKTWKERLGDKAPENRLMSVGLEVFEKSMDSSELKAFRNTLLETGSVDVLYRIHPDKNGKWHVEQALSEVRTDIVRWMPDSQLIWWDLDQISKLVPKDAFSEFERVLKLGEGKDLAWINKLERIFEPGEDVTVNEEEILQVLGKGQPIGKGLPIALIRQPSAPNLYIIAIGISNYRDRALKLKYADKDAIAIVNTFRKCARLLFATIETIQLIDNQATAEGINAVFKKLSNKIKRDDVFVFYLAGHGITLNGKFHFIPWELLYENKESVLQQSISQTKIQKLLANIPALKSLIILDVCGAGLFNAELPSRGLEEKTALDRFLRATGRSTLASASDSKAALEGYKGHGVFTYVLMQGLRGDADQNDDCIITVVELAQFSADKVPEITNKIWQYEQIPMMELSGESFPVGCREDCNLPGCTASK